MSEEFWIVAIGGFFLFGVMPAVIGFFSYQEKKLKLQRDQIKLGGAEVSTQLAATLVELERMRERMAVLERLVTDDDRRLSAEIGRLAKDHPPPR